MTFPRYTLYNTLLYDDIPMQIYQVLTLYYYFERLTFPKGSSGKTRL